MNAVNSNILKLKRLGIDTHWEYFVYMRSDCHICISEGFEALTRIGDSADARVAWLLSDLLRFFQRGEVADTSIASFERLTGAAITNTFPWGQVIDFLIAWDLPAPPGCVDWKRIPFQIIEPT